MLSGIRGLATVIGALALSTMARPGEAEVVPPPLSDTAFDAAFQCPEFLSDDAQRRAALVDYFHWTQARHPDWSIADAIEFKKTLLVRHQCAASLRDLADYAKREEKVVPPK